MKNCWVILLFLFEFFVGANAQQNDSVVNKKPVVVDSVKKDSLQNQVNYDSIVQNQFLFISRDSLIRDLWNKIPLLKNVTQPAVTYLQPQAIYNSKEKFFYFSILVLLLLGVLKKIYSRYFKDIFRVYFKTTLRQEQIKDQLMQSRLPSLLFNIYFFIAAGIYVFLLTQYYGVNIQTNTFKALAGCIAVIALLYSGKLLAIRVFSWIFGVYGMSEVYIFIVFLSNKITGIILAPFIVVIALSSSDIVSNTLFLSYLTLGFLFLYRFIRTYSPVQKEIKLSRFHFFIYLCAFEIAPLLIIYKLLLMYL